MTPACWQLWWKLPSFGFNCGCVRISESSCCITALKPWIISKVNELRSQSNKILWRIRLCEPMQCITIYHPAEKKGFLNIFSEVCLLLFSNYGCVSQCIALVTCCRPAARSHHHSLLKSLTSPDVAVHPLIMIMMTMFLQRVVAETLNHDIKARNKRSIYLICLRRF